MAKKGKNKEFCKAYRAEGRREKNKIPKLEKHLIKHPNDKCALKVLERIM